MASKKPRNSSDTARVAMPADFRIGDVGEVKGQLQQALGAERIELDGSAVERVDTAALQLLLAFERVAGARAHWIGTSVALRDAAGLLGLNGMLPAA